MRLLLSFSLLLLSTRSLAGPVRSCDPQPTTTTDATPPQTTIETFTDCVTRTVIHEVTTPPPPETTIEVFVENVTRTVIHEVTDPAPPKIIVTFVENVTATVIHEVTDPIEEEGSGEGCGIVEEVEIPGETGIIGSSDMQNPCGCKPCECAPCATPAADTKITEISGQSKMCTCAESDECRKEAQNSMDTCMEECVEEFSEFGCQTDDHMKCFKDNNAAIVEAEECLFKNLSDSCAAKDESKFINKTNWDDLTDIAYFADASKDIKENALWKRDETKYNTFQNFFHCTKNCMHKKIQQCTEDKGCSLRMPERETLSSVMNQCTKKNTKIATAILKTCQCLAWTHGVKKLQGSCVVIGNSYYIDRA